MHKNNLLTRNEYLHCMSRLNKFIIQNTINIHHGKNCKKCPRYESCDVPHGLQYLRHGDLYYPEIEKDFK